jgi:endonuclease/exonuclease/phosphatase family metal-dependent hydrolase
MLSLLVCALLIAHGRASLQTRTAAPSVAADAQLLETGSAAQIPAPPPAPAEFKIVSYNIRWRGGEELRALAKLLREDKEIGGALLIGLQEVDRAKERTAHEHTARVLADALGMNYAWAAPPSMNDEEETGVMLLSPYPLQDVTRIVLPAPGPGGRRRVALGATLKLGASEVRVYSVHAETRIKVAQKIAQQQAVLDDLKQHANITRAVILGDFNTWEATAADKTGKLFGGAGFTSALDNDRATFHTFIIELKLDWLWVRGLNPTASGIARHIELSDHWPVWAVVRLQADKQTETPKRRTD